MNVAPALTASCVSSTNVSVPVLNFLLQAAPFVTACAFTWKTALNNKVDPKTNPIDKPVIVKGLKYPQIAYAKYIEKSYKKKIN